MATFQTYTFARTSRSGSTGINPDADERTAVHELLSKAKNTQDAVMILLDRNWSITAICNTVRYAEDSKTLGADGNPVRLAGEPLRQQHVRNIKDKWLARKGAEIGLRA